MKNTGYQQATIVFRVSKPGNKPLDIDGNLCEVSSKKQAVLLLEGLSNPEIDKFEVAGFFRVGEVIDGQQTRVLNNSVCPVPVTGFITVTPDSLSLPTNTSFMYVTVHSSHSWQIDNSVDLLEFDIVSGGPGETKVKISAIGIGGVESIVFKNIVTNDTADLEVDINRGYAKGKVHTLYTEFSCNPNGGGTWATWTITPKDWRTGNHEGWGNDGGEWALNGINKQNLQYIEIGEHYVTRENFRFRYRQDKGDGYANATQEQIDLAFETTPILVPETYAQSRFYNGAYAVEDGVLYDAIKISTFYDNGTDLNEIPRFNIPTARDWAQILSMAPDTSYVGILQFIGVKPALLDSNGNILENGGDESLPYPFDHIMDNETGVWDISGMHVVPSGRRYNVGNGDKTGQFYAYRKSVAFRVATEDGNQADLSVAIYNNAGRNGEGIALHTQNTGATYHLASVRLCRRKTPQELGYELYADTVNDKVLVTLWNAPEPIIDGVKLKPIPAGRLRGICVSKINTRKSSIRENLSYLQSLVDLTNTGNGRWDNFDNY